MCLFTEILCNQLPSINYLCINNDSVTIFKTINNYDSLYNISKQLVYKIYFLKFKNIGLIEKTVSNKFKILFDVIINNNNITDAEKEYFIDKFYFSQKIYSILRRFANKIKFKYCKKFEMDADLCFNPLSNFKPNMLINIIEDNTLYKFRISDIINIINKSLAYAPTFFAEPYKIKNPYTNKPLSLCNLYNIYFTLKETRYNMPILYHQYFITNFDLIKFKYNNECMLRDKAIEYFIKYGDIEEHHYQIQQMFYINYRNILFNLDRQFPRKRLVEVFKKYLKDFLNQEHSLNPEVRELSRNKLNQDLILFSLLNPDFGKRILIKKRTLDEESTNYYTFNDSVISSTNIIPYNHIILPISQNSDNNNDNNHNNDNDSDNNDNDNDNNGNNDTINESYEEHHNID